VTLLLLIAVSPGREFDGTFWFQTFDFLEMTPEKYIEL